MDINDVENSNIANSGFFDETSVLYDFCKKTNNEAQEPTNFSRLLSPKSETKTERKKSLATRAREHVLIEDDNTMDYVVIKPTNSKFLHPTDHQIEVISQPKTNLGLLDEDSTNTQLTNDRLTSFKFNLSEGAGTAKTEFSPKKVQTPPQSSEDKDVSTALSLKLRSRNKAEKEPSIATFQKTTNLRGRKRGKNEKKSEFVPGKKLKKEKEVELNSVDCEVTTNKKLSSKIDSNKSLEESASVDNINAQVENKRRGRPKGNRVHFHEAVMDSPSRCVKQQKSPVKSEVNHESNSIYSPLANCQLSVKRLLRKLVPHVGMISNVFAKDLSKKNVKTVGHFAALPISEVDKMSYLKAPRIETARKALMSIEEELINCSDQVSHALHGSLSASPELATEEDEAHIVSNVASENISKESVLDADEKYNPRCETIATNDNDFSSLKEDFSDQNGTADSFLETQKTATDAEDINLKNSGKYATTEQTCLDETLKNEVVQPSFDNSNLSKIKNREEIPDVQLNSGCSIMTEKKLAADEIGNLLEKLADAKEFLFHLNSRRSAMSDDQKQLVQNSVDNLSIVITGLLSKF